MLRPIKGPEPSLYQCLAATFHQDYPSQKLTVYFCVSSHDDPALPVVERLLDEFPHRDARILVEDEDPALLKRDAGASAMGPNPKIRNMSRGYREAKGDIIWIIDCNVWVDRGVCGRMVDRLCGFSEDGVRRPYKFVHQLPICVDVDCNELFGPDTQDRADGGLGHHQAARQSKSSRSWLSFGGGRLEELFLSSSHAKFYTAINTVAIAPCIVGKSNMFRRSHLDSLTSPTSPSGREKAGQGIDFFSYNICEDHLIGDLLWRSATLGRTSPTQPALGNHALLFGDLAIQPIANMNISAYIARRVRWLRVRKFTVTLATLVEPGTESFLCSAYGAFGLSSLKWFNHHLDLPQTWAVFFTFWCLSVTTWALIDWTVYILLHSGRTIEMDNGPAHSVPPFARPLGRLSRRPFLSWLAAWLGRESLALPIWLWAVWGGTTVVWRDRKFRVSMDMRVHEIEEPKSDGGAKATAHRSRALKGLGTWKDARNNSKRRRD